MNILVVCHYGLYQDFGFSFVHAQTKAYVALGHRVRVIVPIAIGKRDWDGKRFSAPLQRRERDGVELCLLRHLSLSKFGKGWWNPSSTKVAIWPRMNEILKGFSPDVIHAHTLGFDSEIGAWLKGKLGIPLVVTTHGETVCEAWFWKPMRLKTLADKADTVVPVSSMLKKQLSEAHVNVKTPVILNGFRIDNSCPGAKKDPFSLIQVGNLIPSKRVNVTLHALAALIKMHGFPASLTVVGDGPEKMGLEALSRELSVENAVSFTGILPNKEVLKQMRNAAFFVMVSSPEGFGIVYIEAMASGCVTIGTEGEGIADLIVPGENGFLVPPDDPDAIVQTIAWCINHPDEASAIAERGRCAAQGLTWENNARQYTALFQELLGH